MSTRPFRFVHAGDFHLERPLMGVAEVPEHLRNLFCDAPYTAAAKVFEAVLAEDAEFLLLSGDILQPSGTGPRGPLFLVEQFARLAERDIGVYWAGGAVDSPEAWPTALRLPQNVHVFPLGRVEELTLERDAGSLARLAGVGRDRQRTFRPGDFTADPTGLYTIAVAHGDADLSALQARAIDYWALGGRHDRSTPLGGQQVIHYCGSPQGRCPEESGVHGCTLVQVEAQHQTRTSLIPTDAVRWLNQRIAVDETTSREDLETRLRDHLHALLEAAPRVSNPANGDGTAPSTALLISWTIAGSGPLLAQLRRGKLAGELLQWLRSDYGYVSPAAWSLSLDVELVETLPPEWYEQETIRGDFLRAVRQLQMNPEEPLALESYLSETHLAGTLSAAAMPAGKAARDCVLREAAALGVDLLSGEEPQT
jgi:DNA repair protein SbcD/Mre11